MGQWPWCSLFCLSKLPIRRLCLTATKSLFNYHTYKTKNRWRSVDAYSHNGAVTVMLMFLPIKAANTSVMPNSKQIAIRLLYLQDKKPCTLRWRSFSGGGSEIVAAIFTHKGGQYFDYRLMSSHSCWIIQDASTKSVGPTLTLILGDSCNVGASDFGLKGGGYFDYVSQRPCLFLIIRLTRSKIFDASLTLISRMGQWVCRYLFYL